MKKILLIIMILGAAVISLTCERNDLFDSTNDDFLSLINLDFNNPTAIYIYSYPTTQVGNQGGRAGADALCQTLAPPAGTTTVHAFLSVSASDQIRDLVPSAYQGLTVYDVTGANVISSTWTNLWDDNIDMTLSTAGVLGVGVEWWNGSNTDGTLNTNNCLNWTSSSSIDFGRMGNSNFTDTQWINWGSPPCNTNTNFLLCVAY
ncbi:MAG: hypothetical protein A2176_09520 [Spirochaetes bacterium RBG_13_51_14]|nr:MAG: hypothetical protein A2176_09520 [Spirochaetes bacterium RBG_13_51_14]